MSFPPSSVGFLAPTIADIFGRKTVSGIFEMYDRSSALYLLGAGIGAGLLLAAAIVGGFFSENVKTGYKRFIGSDGWFAIGIAAALFGGRWPYLCFRHFFNPDESQQIAGAITLTHDPRFWLSVDGATAGPMDFYPLCLPAWLGSQIDYSSARLTALCLIFGTLWFGYRTLRFSFPVQIARIGIVPLALFFGWVIDPDFVEISTEHVPIFLFSAAFYFFLKPLFRSGTPGTNRLSWFLAGLAAGLAPWAKLQAAVATVAFTASALWFSFCSSSSNTWRVRVKTFWPFLAGLALPTIAFAPLIGITGQVETFYRSYLAANLDYTYRGTAKLYLLWQFWWDGSETGFFPILFLITLAWTGTALFYARKRFARVSRFFWFIFGYTIVGFCTVISPGRPFLHYLLFVIPALGLLLASAWREILRISGSEERTASIAFFLFSTAVPLLLIRTFSPVPFSGQLSAEWNRPLSAAANRIKPFLRPGDTIALWGWEPNLYVELNLPQGVRDAHTQREIENTPFRDYYRDRYLADLAKSRPIAFVDAVGLDGFVFRDRALVGYETFPALKRYLDQRYTLVDDRVTGRVFIRNDRLLGEKAELRSLSRPIAHF